MIREKSAGVIACDLTHPMEPEYLLLRYSLGHWDFPKGHVESTETPQQTAVRELQEETSLSPTVIEFIPGFHERISYNYMHAGKRHFKEVDFFLVQSHTQSIVLSQEHIEFAWLPYSSAIIQVTYENARTVLRKAHTFLTQKFSQKNLTDF